MIKKAIYKEPFFSSGLSNLYGPRNFDPPLEAWLVEDDKPKKVKIRRFRGPTDSDRVRRDYAELEDGRHRPADNIFPAKGYKRPSKALVKRQDSFSKEWVGLPARWGEDKAAEHNIFLQGSWPGDTPAYIKESRINNILVSAILKDDGDKSAARAFVLDFLQQLSNHASASEIVESFLSMDPRPMDSLPAAFLLDVFEDSRYVSAAISRAFNDLGIDRSNAVSWYQALPKSYTDPLPKILMRFWDLRLSDIVQELDAELEDAEGDVRDFILEMSPDNVTIYTDKAKDNGFEEKQAD